MPRMQSPMATRSFKRDRRAWVILMLAVGAVIYWSLAGRNSTSLGKVHTYDHVSKDPLVLILAYERILANGESNGVSATRLESHLQVLRDNGYQAVGLNALASYYLQNQPLPPKTVLVMFDGGYLSTYDEATPVLKALGWKAVMAVSTDRIMARDTHRLYWDRLKKMKHSGFWDLASSGHTGQQMINTSPEGQIGPFQAHRRWIEEQNRLESYAEYSQRIMDDLRTGKKLIAENLNGFEAIAYVPPWKHFDRIIDDPKIRSLMDKAVQNQFQLVFADDLFGVNLGRTSTLRIKRMRVDEALTAQALAAYLNALDACALNGGTMPAGTRWPWRSGFGRVTENAGLWTFSQERQADMWLPGSLIKGNWQMEADIQRTSGQFWLVQRDAMDPNRLWRVGGDQNGLLVQYRNGSAFSNLAAFPVGMEKSARHKLSVTKRGRALWVALDQRPLSTIPVRLEQDLTGDIGWIAWQSGGPVAVRLDRIRLKPLASRSWIMPAKPTEQNVQELIRSAKHIEKLKVPMWKLTNQGLQSHEVDYDLLLLLCHRYCFEVFPMVNVDPELSWPSVSQGIGNYDRWLQMIKDGPWHSIVINLSDLNTSQLRVFDPLWGKMQNDVQKMNRRLLRMANGRERST